MTVYIDRVKTVHARLQNLARDLESHLGLASRSYESEPMFDRASQFLPAPHHDDTVRRVRETNIARFIREYADQAARAVFTVRDLQLPGTTLTHAEARAAIAVTDLADAFQTITTHSDAVALVASIKE